MGKSQNKLEAIKCLSDKNGIIAALAIDQRGSLRKMMGTEKGQASIEDMENYKILISEELTPYSSAILLDPEFGLPASKKRSDGAGLLLAYEKTGYDANAVGRLPDILSDWSVRALKEAGADAIKFLLYYDVDEDEEINHQKHVFMERVGSECKGEDIPFFLELLAYDCKMKDTSGPEFALKKPRKVNEMVREFTKEKYNVDVLKLEVPVNMKYVEGYSDEAPLYSKSEALSYFKEQSDIAKLPFIFLSAGVSAEMFLETLKFAHEAGSNFCGVLCGRATWKDSVAVYANEGQEACRNWLRTKGRQNIEDLNKVLKATAKSWHGKI